MLEGGCFCKAIRYAIEGTTFDATLCHCTDCRRLSAAPLVAWVSVKRAEFRLLQGKPKSFASSPTVLRTFCPDCGTHLSYQHHDFPDEIDISTCSLDHPELIVPEHHTWLSHKLPWLQVSDMLPRYAGAGLE